MNILRYDRTVPSAKSFIRRMQAEQPSLVHICDCWSRGAWRVMRRCKAMSVPVVISPCRLLEPWHVRHHFWWSKLPQLLLYQRGMIQRAHAIVATTEQEQRHLLSMGLHPSVGRTTPWNDRVVYVPDYRRTAAISEDDMKQAYAALYRKVLDSHPRMLMTANDRLAEDTLLRLGLGRDELSRAISEEQAERVRKLGPESWRRLLLHADDEGVLAEVRTGAALLQIAPQSIAGIDRFAPREKKNREPLDTQQARLKPQLMEEYAAEIHAAAPEKTVCAALLNTIREKQRGTLSRRHLADLYTVVRFTDYDEQRLCRLLKLLKEQKRAAQLLQTLRDTLGLEEGFVPMGL